MQRWYMERFKELLDQLKGVNEGGKPMLDNMLVVYVERAVHPLEPRGRAPRDLDRRQGGRRPASTGRYIDFGGQNDHNQFLVTMCHAMGAKEVTKVGTWAAAGRCRKFLA